MRGLSSHEQMPVGAYWLTGDLFHTIPVAVFEARIRINAKPPECQASWRASPREWQGVNRWPFRTGRRNGAFKTCSRTNAMRL
jgi:hypothetical protein